MKIKELFITLLLLVSLSSCGGNSFARSFPKSTKLPVIFESTINLIVDGKPVNLSKKFQCKISQYSKAGGDRFSEVSQTGFAVSHKLPTGEFIIASMPYSCGRFGVDKRDDNGKPLSYKITNPLPDNFLPYIAIADKGPVPDKVIVYASNLAYKAKAARIEFKGITLNVAPKGSKPSKQDEFNWFLSYGGGDGPYYHSFVLRKAVMFPEMRKLLDENAKDIKEPVRLLFKGSTQWFSKFYHTIIPAPETAYGKMKMHEKIFPSKKWGKPKRGGNTNPSPYEEISTNFLLKDNTDFSKDTLELTWDKNYEGMNIFYRLPSEHFYSYGTIYRTKNLKYKLPNGGIYYTTLKIETFIT